MVASFDVVLVGASGFAGKLTAEYLARNAPNGLRWALAGRDQSKLEAVRAELAVIDPALATLPLRSADVTDPASLDALVGDTKVLATTVGPYLRHGEPLVAACAAAGTDYVDLTGEPEFVDRMFVRHHDSAVASGARLVHCCGFDSIPHDLGAFFTVRQLPEGHPVRMRGYVEASAAASGGTLASALNAMSRLRPGRAAASDRRKLEGRPTDRSVRAVGGRPHHAAVTRGWALPLPTIDPQVVARSARADARYGPDFSYSHFVSVPHAWTAAGIAAGAVGLVGAAQIPPARRFVQKRLPQGDGPSAAKRAKSWFRVTFEATSGERRVVTRVSGGDPGYDETARMFAESALCLALDDLPATTGQVTTATAMGEALLARLQRSGMPFRVLDRG